MRYWIFPFFVLTALFTACSQAPSAKTEQVSIDGGAVEYPLHQAVAEEFHKAKPDSRISVASSGTGGGISKFCGGGLDIVGASRPILAEETKTCAKRGIQYIELPIAIDGIAVIANKNNSSISCLSISELNDIWKPRSKISNWNQINSEVPNLRLKLYAPASDTGTFDYFTGTEGWGTVKALCVYAGGEESGSRADASRQSLEF